MTHLIRALIQGAVLKMLCLLCFAGPAMSEARLEELGMLFTDAAQRQKLDALRHGALREVAERNSPVSSVTVNGVMLRRGGRNVVWVNDRSSLEGSPVQGVKVLTGSADPERYQVPVMVDGKLVNIKPGQSWSEGTGAVRDSY